MLENIGQGQTLIAKYSEPQTNDQGLGIFHNFKR